MRNVTLEITRDDIDRGFRVNCRWCPMARAIGRVVSGTFSVSRFNVVGDGPGGTWSQPTTPAMQQFIAGFDAGHDVHPEAFAWRIPDEAFAAPAGSEAT